MNRTDLDDLIAMLEQIASPAPVHADHEAQHRLQIAVVALKVARRLKTTADSESNNN